jgi:hypothetical protein
LQLVQRIGFQFQLFLVSERSSVEEGLLDVVVGIESEKRDEDLESDCGGVVVILTVFVVGGFDEIIDQLEIDAVFVLPHKLEDAEMGRKVLLFLLGLPSYVPD